MERKGMGKMTEERQQQRMDEWREIAEKLAEGNEEWAVGNPTTAEDRWPLTRGGRCVGQLLYRGLAERIAEVLLTFPVLFHELEESETSRERWRTWYEGLTVAYQDTKRRAEAAEKTLAEYRLSILDLLVSGLDMGKYYQVGTKQFEALNALWERDEQGPKRQVSAVLVEETVCQDLQERTIHAEAKVQELEAELDRAMTNDPEAGDRIAQQGLMTIKVDRHIRLMAGAGDAQRHHARAYALQAELYRALHNIPLPGDEHAKLNLVTISRESFEALQHKAETNRDMNEAHWQSGLTRLGERLYAASAELEILRRLVNRVPEPKTLDEMDAYLHASGLVPDEIGEKGTVLARDILKMQLREMEGGDSGDNG